MITKELIKSEIDKVNEEYIVVLYKIIKALESPMVDNLKFKRRDSDVNWHQFIKATYGCLAEDPIERGDQGKFEIREEIV